MAQIDTSKWAAFDLADLFDFSLPKGDLQVKKVTDGNIPLITPINTNNGLIQRISDLSESTLYDANELTVDMFGNAYYQDEPFFVTAHGHVNVLIPKFSMNKYIGLFLATSIKSMFMRKYGFSDMCTQKVLKVEKINLPISSDGAPDWLFMEDFIKSKEANIKDAISNLLSTEEMKKDEIDIAEWKDFKIEELFVTNKKGTQKQVPTGANISQKDLKEGETPRITVTNINNGINGYYSINSKTNDYRVFENFISVSFLGTIFYHPYKASLDMKVHCLQLKDIKLRNNQYVNLFLISALKTSLKGNYSDQISSKLLPSLSIKLPTTPLGNPNWEYMENYMKDVEEKTKERLNNLI